MPIFVRPTHRLLAIAGLAVAAVWACAGLFAGSGSGLHKVSDA